MASMSLSLFLFCRQVHLCYILYSKSKWHHIVFAICFLTSLRMIISSLHQCCCKWQYFIVFTASSIPLYTCTPSSLSIPLDGHLGCSHVLALVDSAAMKVRVMPCELFVVSCLGYLAFCRDAWRIPGMGKPGWLPSMGSPRVEQD